jgi:hypothetical protein
MAKTDRKSTGRGTKGQMKKRDLGYVIDPYRGKLLILAIGQAAADGENAELAYKIDETGDSSADWRNRSELLSVHLSRAAKKETQRILILRC